MCTVKGSGAGAGPQVECPSLVLASSTPRVALLPGLVIGPSRATTEEQEFRNFSSLAVGNAEARLAEPLTCTF